MPLGHYCGGRVVLVLIGHFIISRGKTEWLRLWNGFDSDRIRFD